jgi:hypothetical protein
MEEKCAVAVGMQRMGDVRLHLFGSWSNLNLSARENHTNSLPTTG